jgi:fumarate reductase flavoprotein subunit
MKTPAAVSIRNVAAGSVTPQIPIAIVGGGACGVVAALAAQRVGVDCLVLERDATPSGSTALSSGFIPAAATLAQQRAGVVDSNELFADDIQRKAKFGADPTLVAAFSQTIGPTLDWLEQEHGMQFEVLRDFLYPGHSVARMHSVPQRSGDALLARLWARAQSLRIPLLSNANVVNLLREPNGAIVGLDLQRPNGTRETIGCEQLILACNGFGGNPTMVARFIPQMRDALYFGHAGNTGAAMAWGQALGARLADTGAYQGHGSVAQPHGLLITWALIMAGGIQVNQSGARFWDESQGYSEAALAVLAQADGVAWNIFDERVHQLGVGFPEYQQAIKLGAVKRADDSAALARAIGADYGTLSAELNAIEQAALAAPQHDRFGRRFVLEQRLRAPWYAIKVTGALFHTQGGLAVDGQMRVLREDDSVIDKLRAAGGAARGVSGAAVWGYLSGNGLLSAIAGGYLAGTASAADCQRPCAAGTTRR